MPVRKKRPIYTRVGRIKPLGKSRMVKKAKPRPWRPFKITSYRLKERLPRVEGLIIHRRPSGRPDIALDPRELRAVSLSKVRGTLPERIFYKQLRKRRLSPDRDFDFQSSLLGGRLQLGGIVADFLFPLWRLIVRIQGPTHKTRVQSLKDQRQMQLLADMGWTVYDLPDEIVYDMMALETWMRRHIDRHPSLGGQQVIGQTIFLATGQMNFAWTAQEHTRVARLEDAVENIIRDMGRIEGKAVVTINGLSDINSNLGLVQAGEFRVGNSKYPGQGFSGVRTGWPAFVYNSEDWHIAGVNNDVLQFGLRATDGVAFAGAGAVILDEDGIRLDVSGYDTSYIKWFDGTMDSSTNTIGWMLDDADQTGSSRVAVIAISRHNDPNATGHLSKVELSAQDQDGEGSRISVGYGPDLSAWEENLIVEVNIGSGYKNLFMIDYENGAGIIFNKDNVDIDFVMEGLTDPNLFKIDSGLDRGYYRGVEIATLLDFDNTSGSQANSTAWYKAYEVVIPAGTLGPDDGVYIEAFCAELNNSGGNRIIQRRYVVNGVAYQFTDDTQTSSAITRPDHGRLFITNQGAVNSQERWGYWENHSEVIQGTNSIDTSITALTISLELRFSTAHANAIVYKRGGQTLMMRI